MWSLVALTLLFISAAILLSFIPKGLGKKILIPIAFVFVSIILFFTSFLIGRWEGMGLGAVSVSLFVASIIALPAIVLLNKRKASS
ncbi:MULTISPECIES: YesK family protein [unclassified Oceanobacillus]|uniref:YesK family protein n=1 Tax=unclassified Oceanobacillus TaxID=2630292 RepID=UPI00300DEF27